MPKISLVVCLYKERDLLQRLLCHSAGCYDDLLIVHDGPEFQVTSRLSDAAEPSNPAANRPGWKSPEKLSLNQAGHPPKELAIDYAKVPSAGPLPDGYRLRGDTPEPDSVYELVKQHHGRFYEGARCFQQEAHWPFAWWAAEHDWILRMDADEFPSPELIEWLKNFRLESEVSQPDGFTCIWPLWDGKKTTTTQWPAGRLFLFDKRKVNFFGMAEHVPSSNGQLKPVDVVLNHQPRRKSYGVRNILFRKQAYRWRTLIADTLMGSPLDLPRWNWNEKDWPEVWLQKKRNPLLKAFIALIWFFLCQIRSMQKNGENLDLSAALNPSIHHFLLQIEICRKLWRIR